MPRILYPEWRDQLDSTKYPFSALAHLKNDTGQIILEGCISDAHLYPIGGKARLYLSKVTITNQAITFTLGDEEVAQRATGVLTLADNADHVALYDEYDRPAGILISEQARLAAFLGWGVGTFEFTVEETEFAATCCMPAPELGVRALVLEDGSVFAGQVWIVGDDGVVVRRETEVLADACGTTGTRDVIRVDIVGDPLFRRRLCTAGELFSVPRVVRGLRVTHSGPTFTSLPQDGNISLQANDALAPAPAMRVRTTDDGLLIETVGHTTRQGGGAPILNPDYGT